MNLRRWGLVWLWASVASACTKEIVVVEGCDLSLRDAGDADGSPADASAVTDAGTGDGGPGDAGNPSCQPGGYCIRSLLASTARANVREQVTFTPEITNPAGTSLAFSVRPGELESIRAPGRPPLRLADIALELSVDAAGTVSFRVQQVPPWFVATTFVVRLYAKGPAPQDPEVYADAEVHIRGNVALSMSGSNGLRVYTVASDGRPAAAVTPGSTLGELVVGLATQPRALLMSQSGHLLVLDTGPNEPRILRFELTGENVQVGTFDAVDGQGAALFDRSNNFPFSLAQLPDGRVVAIDNSATRTPTARLLMFRPNGTFERAVSAAVPNQNWAGVGVRNNGELLVVSRESTSSQVLRLDPQNGAILEPPLVDALPSGGRSVLGEPGGGAYVGLEGSVELVRPGGVQIRIATLPSTPIIFWRILAPFDDGQILAANDTSAEDDNVALIRDRDFVGWLRSAQANGSYGYVNGMAYLE